MLFYITERNYIRNYTVYNEGDTVEGFYLIISGNFQVIKHIKEKNSKFKDTKIVTLDRFLIAGVEELLLDIPKRTTSLKCVTQKGQLYHVSKGIEKLLECNISDLFTVQPDITTPGEEVQKIVNPNVKYLKYILENDICTNIEKDAIKSLKV